MVYIILLFSLDNYVYKTELHLGKTLKYIYLIISNGNLKLKTKDPAFFSEGIVVKIDLRS